jgi:chemotaxis protein histidine kinase CheA
MDSALSFEGALQDFLLDAQVLLSQSRECLQHLELIDNDADACGCLNTALDTLARRATRLDLLEVAHYATVLQQLLAPACQQQRLQREALPATDACLTLLAWQLELIDPRTGQLNLDTDEQITLLNELASVLEQPLPQACAACDERGSHCTHPHTATTVAQGTHSRASH